MMIWEVLEGRIAWDNLRFEEIEQNVVNGARPEISDSVMDTKHYWVISFLSIMKNCWSGDPKDRPMFENIIDTLRQV